MEPNDPIVAQVTPHGWRAAWAVLRGRYRVSFSTNGDRYQCRWTYQADLDDEHDLLSDSPERSHHGS